MIDNQDQSIPEGEIDSFLALARKQRNLDLSSYRKTFIGRRLWARFCARRIDSFVEYVALLNREPEEWDRFVENLSIKVSEFFRDPNVFRLFEKLCLPQLVKTVRQRRNKVIRVWSCGCSQGEEAYSLAIMFGEFFKRQLARGVTVQIWASDIDDDSLAKAREGCYLKESLQNLAPEILEEYFTFIPKESPDREYDSWQVKGILRDLVLFQRHDLIFDEPLKFMDIIFFRNVRIYFKGAKAKDILLAIHDSLRPGGYLVLGKVESVGLSLRHVFEPVDIKERIYRRI